MIDAFLNAPAGLALQSLLGATLLTFLLGVIAAARDGTFDWKYIDAFVKDPFGLKVGPVAVALVFAYFTNNLLVLSAAIATAGAVALAMVNAIVASLSQLRMSKPTSAMENTLPGTPPPAK